MVVPEILTNVASNVLTELGKQAWRKRGFLTRAASLLRRRPGQMVFVPEGAGLHCIDVRARKLVVRLVLLGSPGWTRGRPISMVPSFRATLHPEGRAGYYFTNTNSFQTAPVPRGMHAYFIGQIPLHADHLDIDPLTSTHGLLMDGSISVENLGPVPILPLAILTGAYGEGGGFLNEPIELHALRQSRA